MRFAGPSVLLAMKPTLLILAAGMGSRFGGLKQLEGLGPSGETILEYSVYDALRAGFGKVVFVIRQDFRQAFKERISQKFLSRVPVDHVFQELDDLPEGFVPPPERQKPWGTGHAVLCARRAIEEPFAVINADDFYGRAGFATLADYLSGGPTHTPWPAPFALVAYPLGRTVSAHGPVSRGICQVDEDGYLKNVVERPAIESAPDGPYYRDAARRRHTLANDTPTSMNLWGFTPALFDFLENGFKDFLAAKASDPKAEFYLPQAVADMIRRRQAKVRVLRTDAPWMGLTYPQDLPEVRQRLQALIDGREYPRNLWG